MNNENDLGKKVFINNVDDEIKEFEKRLQRIELNIKVKPNFSEDWIKKLRVKI